MQDGRVAGGKSLGWLVAIGIAITVFYAASEFRTSRRVGLRPPPPPRGSIDISRGSRSSAFTDFSPIPTNATLRYAASPQNVAKGKDVYCPETHCAFALSEVVASDAAYRTVKIVGDYPGSTSELTYTCVDCSAGLRLDAFNIPEFTRARGFSGPGVVLVLNADATALSVECRSKTCTTRQNNGETREFPKGGTVTLPVNTNLHFSFSRL